MPAISRVISAALAHSSYGRVRDDRATYPRSLYVLAACATARQVVAGVGRYVQRLRADRPRLSAGSVSACRSSRVPPGISGGRAKIALGLYWIGGGWPIAVGSDQVWSGRRHVVADSSNILTIYKQPHLLPRQPDQRLSPGPTIRCSDKPMQRCSDLS